MFKHYFIISVCPSYPWVMPKGGEIIFLLRILKWFPLIEQSLLLRTLTIFTRWALVMIVPFIHRHQNLFYSNCTSFAASFMTVTPPFIPEIFTLILDKAVSVSINDQHLIPITRFHEGIVVCYNWNNTNNHLIAFAFHEKWSCNNFTGYMWKK